jgi:hypothetical protein
MVDYGIFSMKYEIWNNILLLLLITELYLISSCWLFIIYYLLFITYY